MAEGLDKAIGQLKSMLSTEEGQREIEGILNSVTGGDKAEAAAPANAGPLGLDSFARIKSVMDNMQLFDDPRTRLLASLRPYISKTRGRHIDSAIKLMALSRLPYLLKNNKIDK